MAIKLDCPRCKKPLSVPRKKVGHYVHCPRCGGRFWVPENAAADSSGADADSAAVTTPGTPGFGPTAASQPPEPPEKLPATVSMRGAPTVTLGGLTAGTPQEQKAPSTQDAGTRPLDNGGAPLQVVPPAASASSSSAAPGGYPPPASGEKTARLVSAETAQSTLKVAEDGKLPELRLAEGQQRAKKEGRTTSVNPLVLFGLLALSAVLSAVLAWVDVGPPQSPIKNQARRQIEERFFPRDTEEPLPYQGYLMEAQRASTRGDHAAERQAYEKVLDLLRQERPPYIRDDRPWSVTGSPRGDEDLKGLIATVLSND
jgi:DNA-directed RNA polymerase subunit RPC12/RpoP